MRSILGTPVARNQGVTTTKPDLSAPGARTTGAQLAAVLRRKRSPRYIDRMKRLDAGGHVHDRTALEELLAGIADEFPDLAIDQRPIGIVARCYLGSPYEVHTCDTAGGIIEHFETYRSMPPLFERARGLAAHGAYAFIEIYVDSLRAIGGDGTVAVI